jgi:Skp family chaperone for outer membrane proteins
MKHTATLRKMASTKLLSMLFVLALLPLQASAQKFALIDMEYVLKNIPAYERANEQLNQVSKKWQAEVEALKYRGRHHVQEATRTTKVVFPLAGA